MKPIIEVDRISKLYQLGSIGATSIRESFDRWWHKAMGKEYLLRPIGHKQITTNPDDPQIGPEPNTMWSLKDVSFSVERGEIIGLIGKNGAGKSTLLKILSKITEPTSGRAVLRGRASSLLEVGTGFHPDLTGRENVYLNGAILGMRRAEINNKFDEIVSFAEIEKFIDTPVKHYSSGMYVRLAFAVSAHLEPEILLVDEVLAVGDASFQKKCLGKMAEVAKGGRTILFVSHNMAAIQNLCERVALIANGKIKYIGEKEAGIRQYMEVAVTPHQGDVDLSSHAARRPGCKPILRRVRLLGKDSIVKSQFMCGEKMMIEFTFDPVEPIRDPQFGIGVDDWMKTRIFSVATYYSNSKLPAIEKQCKITCSLGELPLCPGTYSLSLSSGTIHEPLMDALDQAITFEVEPTDYFYNGRMPVASLGRVLVRSQWERVES